MKNIAFVSELLIIGIYFLLTLCFIAPDSIGVVLMDFIQIGNITTKIPLENSINLTKDIADYGTKTTAFLVVSYIVGVFLNITSESLQKIGWFQQKIQDLQVVVSGNTNFVIENAKYTLIHHGFEGFAETVAYYDRMSRLLGSLFVSNVLIITVILYVNNQTIAIVLSLILLSYLIYLGFIHCKKKVFEIIVATWKDYLFENNQRLSFKNPFLAKQETVLIFAGGSAVRDINIEFIQGGYSTIRIVTAFDSGGSSKTLRNAFNMPSIGDIRNALMQMVSAKQEQTPVVSVLNWRLPNTDDLDDKAPKKEFKSFMKGDNQLFNTIDEIDVKEMIKIYLKIFFNNTKQLNHPFDFRNGSIGNFVLMGIYFAANKDINAATYLFRNMLKIYDDKVFLNSVDSTDIKAVYEDNSFIEGQENITKENLCDGQLKYKKIKTIKLISKARINKSLKKELSILKDNRHTYLIRTILYGPGSFFTSTLQHLYVDGFLNMAKQVQSKAKILVLPFKKDKETYGYTQAELVSKFCDTIKEIEKCEDNQIHYYLNYVFIHESVRKDDENHIAIGDIKKAINKYKGITLIKEDFEDTWNKGKFNAKRICEVINRISQKVEFEPERLLEKNNKKEKQK